MIFIRQIQRATEEFFDLPPETMTSPSRLVKHSHPRMMAMTICSILTKHSGVKIGQMFHRDHSTVIHAVRTARARCSDPHVSLAMKAIAHRLLLEEAGDVSA